MPLKVCLFIGSLGPDAGNQILLARLAESLDPALVEVHVCCYEESRRLANLRPSVRRAVFPLDKVTSLTGMRQVYRFRRYLEENRIDVVHSFENNSAIFTVLAALGQRGRAVITSRLNCGYWYTSKELWIFRFLNRYSTHILTNSAAAKKITADVEKVSPERITVFYPGVDLARFAPSSAGRAAANGSGIPANARVVGIVANFRPVKNLELFLQAAAVVAAAEPGAAFLLVGQGSQQTDLHHLAGRLGIADRIFFSSPEIPVPEYLSAMSVACLSSKSEGLPNVIMEYMAAGLPVVATDVGGVGELVRDGETGYLVREQTPEAFAAPIIRLLRSEPLRTAMGLRSREIAEREFDGAAAVRRLERFYADAAADVQGRTSSMRPPLTLPRERK